MKETTVSEVPPDQQPIPLVKFSGTPDYAPQPTKAGEDLLVICELVNIGTGPTSAADQLWGSLVLQNTIIHQDHQNLDSPPVDANGGSRRYSFTFEGRFLAPADDWSIDLVVTNAAGEIADDVKIPITLGH
jgi:hypothetical protein